MPLKLRPSQAGGKTALNILVAEWLITLYSFGGNITHYKTESVHFWGAYELSNKDILVPTRSPRQEQKEPQAHPMAKRIFKRATVESDELDQLRKEKRHGFYAVEC